MIADIMSAHHDAPGAEHHLEAIREAEFAAVRYLFRPGLRVLELGGGTGYQASQIAALGCEVTSIDLAERHRPYQLFYPVIEYDGRHIPAADASIDLVFSSYVLEHIPHLAELLRESRRVLDPQGLAVHVVPTAAWRAWTSVAFFPHGASWRWASGAPCQAWSTRHPSAR
jgi:ubiquinone/menaquinone biosynthesis C-methylase UbiE